MTTYLVALMLVVASIQIYLLWRLLSTFDVLRRFDDRLSRYGDALSLLTETTETGFDSLGRELERLRTLGDIRAEMRAGTARGAHVAPRHAAAEAVAEALIARVDATPAHTLVAREPMAPARDAGGPSVGGPTVAFVPVAGEASPRVTVETPRVTAETPSVTFIDTTSASRPARDVDLQPAAASSPTVVQTGPSAAPLERRTALAVETLDDATVPERAVSDPVGDVVRLIESAQGRPTPAQLNEAAVRLRMHLAGGTARARGTARGAATMTRGRQESPNGALRS